MELLELVDDIIGETEESEECNMRYYDCPRCHKQLRVWIKIDCIEDVGGDSSE